MSGRGGQARHNEHLRSARDRASEADAADSQAVPTPTWPRSICKEVMHLRRTNVAGAAAAGARLRSALLEAGRQDAAVEGALLGMAAAQCARLALPDLLCMICAYATSRLQECGGREVAEMGSALFKLGLSDVGFLRAVAEYCAKPPRGAFKSMRDVAMAATLLGQSERASTADVDHVAALKGLAAEALPQLRAGKCQVRDVVEFAHAVAHSLESASSDDAHGKLHAAGTVQVALSASFVYLRCGMHRASARDVAMAAGAVASAWSWMPGQQESELQPCLCDVADAARFRFSEFEMRDFALIAAALAKVKLRHPGFACMLNEQASSHIAKSSSRDLCFLLWAAACVPEWDKEPFAKTVMFEVRRRGPSQLSPQDLCTLAQSLARLGEPRTEILEALAEEAFSRQLWHFGVRDCASLLWALTKSNVIHAPLCTLLIRTLSSNTLGLQKGLASTVLWSLSELQPPSSVRAAKNHGALTKALCLKEPWLGSEPREMVRMTVAFVRLQDMIPLQAWSALISEVCELEASVLTFREVLLVLTFLAGCPVVPDCSTDKLESHISRFLLALELCEDAQEIPEENRISFLAAFARSGRSVPEKVVSLLRYEEVPNPEREHEHLHHAEVERVPETEDLRFPDTPIVHMCPPGLSTMEQLKLLPMLDDLAPHHGGIGCPPCFRHHKNMHDEGRVHASHGQVDVGVETATRSTDSNPSSDGHRLISCTNDDCCPAMAVTGSRSDVRLNNHCDYTGHCVQVKNTFLHIPCNLDDSDSDTECVVCRFARAQSCDDVTKFEGLCL